jgi:hypothetical protein
MTTPLFFLILFVVLLVIFVIIIPKALIIEFQIVINKPVSEVFDFVKLLKNHDRFNPYAIMEPDRQKKYSGIDGTVGFVYRWESLTNKTVGTGEQEITEIENEKLIAHEIRFIKPRVDTAQAKFYFEPLNEHQTKVIWGFYSTLKGPFKLLKPLLRKMLGKNTMEGLTNLKTILEQ